MSSIFDEPYPAPYAERKPDNRTQSELAADGAASTRKAPQQRATFARTAGGYEIRDQTDRDFVAAIGETPEEFLVKNNAKRPALSAPDALTPGEWINNADSAERKRIPLAQYLRTYCPDAIAALAAYSRIANEKHNPGQPLHWSRHKSNDHADCVARHLLGLGTKDQEGHRHELGMAWRAIAILQLAIEQDSEAFAELLK